MKDKIGVTERESLNSEIYKSGFLYGANSKLFFNVLSILSRK